ncbi:MAG: pantoate--beta-alanine ligase, partial [Candidatus Omnitrophica bacterium]|nr:pantoate--beta-alanine ligase [Candidatus Omnitrophota bacterium]
ALHAGHGALIAASVAQDDVTIVSVFVNRIQFGPNEDFDRYPRTLKKDYAFSQRFGSVIFFAPSERELLKGRSLPVYPKKYFRRVMCDPFRPKHFDGVVSIVLYFLKIINPKHMYLGIKDYQQYRILKKTVQAVFGGRIETVGVSTVRHKSGLAMSSRNRYLSACELKAAAQMRKNFRQIAEEFKKLGITAYAAVQKAGKSMGLFPGFKLQYFEILDLINLTKVSQKYTKFNQYVCAWAVQSTSARLIDNVLL